VQSAEINWRPLGELFVETGLITPLELEEALTEQAETDQRLGEILVARGFVSEPDLVTVLMEQLGQDLNDEGAADEPTVVDLDLHRAQRFPAGDADDTGGPAGELGALLRERDGLREQLARETASREAATGETVHALQARVSELEAELIEERADHRRALEELERARTEARTEAAEIRSAIGRLRAELAHLDAPTAWFEYWSGGAQPASSSGTEPTSTE
jgi:hypothetical protein